MLRSVCLQVQADSGPKFMGLEKGKKLSQNLVNKHFVPIHQWG